MRDLGGGKCIARAFSVWSHVVAMLYAHLVTALVEVDGREVEMDFLMLRPLLRRVSWRIHTPQTDYATVLAMLRAIENKTLQAKQKPVEPGWRSSPPELPTWGDIAQIVSIKYRATEGVFDIMTRDRDYSGRSFLIQKEDEFFVCLGAVRWRVFFFYAVFFK